VAFAQYGVIPPQAWAILFIVSLSFYSGTGIEGNVEKGGRPETLLLSEKDQKSGANKKLWSENGSKD
jgi:hypothetical protein